MTTRVFSLSDCTYPHIINQAKSHTKVVFNSSQSRDFQSRHEHVLSGDVCSICKKERKKEMGQMLRRKQVKSKAHTLQESNFSLLHQESCNVLSTSALQIITRTERMSSQNRHGTNS